MEELFVAGVILIVLGIWELLGTLLRELRCNWQVTARVAYIDTKPDMRSGGNGFQECYFPIYEYEIDGKVYQIPGAECSSRPDCFKVNAQKQIRYNPKNPNECIIDGNWKKVVIGIILLAAGGMITLFTYNSL